MASVVDRHIGGWLVFSVSTAVAGRFVWETGRWCWRGVVRLPCGGGHEDLDGFVSLRFYIVYIFNNVTGVAIFVTSIRSSVAYGRSIFFSSAICEPIRESIRSKDRLKDANVSTMHIVEGFPWRSDTRERNDGEELEFTGARTIERAKAALTSVKFHF